MKKTSEDKRGRENWKYKKGRELQEKRDGDREAGERIGRKEKR